MNPENPKPFRVLMLDPSGSGAMVTHDLCNYLANMGCTTEVFTGPHWMRAVADAKMSYQPRIEFYRKSQLRSYQSKNPLTKAFWLGARFLDHLKGMNLVRRNASRFDVLHAHFFPAPLVDAIFLKLIRRHTPLVCTVHELEPHISRWRSLTRVMHKLIYRSADALLVHTPATRAQLIREYGIAEDKILAVRIGRMERLLSEKPEAPSDESSKTPSILLIGHIAMIKGIDVLLKSVPEIRKRTSSFKVVIAGKSNFDLSPWRRSIDEQGLGAYVEFDDRYLTEEEFAGYMAAATIVVLPYRRVEQSAVAIAACTFGKAIVASRCGGLEQMVEEAGNGVLVPVGDAPALGRALADLLLDEQKRSKYERRSQTYALNQLSMNTVATQTKMAYETAIRNRAGIAQNGAGHSATSETLKSMR